MHEICYLSGGGPSSPSRRFRVLPYLERFRRDGIGAEMGSLPRLRAARVVSLLRLRRRGTVVLHRVLLRGWELSLLRSGPAQLVFDFDDALPEVSDAPSRRQRRLRRWFRATTAAADKIVAGNACLADAVVEQLPRAPGTVLVLPTPVDTERFRPVPEGTVSNPAPVLVWSGSDSNLPYLQEVVPALRKVAARCDYQLRVVCNSPLAAEGLPLENRRWSPETEVSDVATGDVNLMPLPDTPWTRGKCGYKLLLGMSCGVASVASPVGINREIVAEGRAGLLAGSQDEWVAALTDLIRDPALRARLGRAGRERVLAEYSLDRAYPRLRDFLTAPLAASGRAS